jgi:2-methylisocitrate lyase-like PEP mutase family enzyme
MPSSPAEKIAAFHALHESGCFALPNPWDAGSARYLEALGFKALASTSAGFAWSTGKLDYQLRLDELLEHLRILCTASDLPVNADFEGGFAVAPEGVAANVVRALEAGVAGLSIEDRSEPGALEPLFDLDLAVDRIRAARRAIDESRTGVVLTARCEGYLVGRAALEPTLARLIAYAEAGADCLYAPGIVNDDDIRAVVEAVAPKPVNVLAFDYAWTTQHLAGLGVRRISLGGALARKAYAEAMNAAKAWLDSGSLATIAAQPPSPFPKVFG